MLIADEFSELLPKHRFHLNSMWLHLSIYAYNGIKVYTERAESLADYQVYFQK